MAPKNTLTGFVEPFVGSSFQFDMQRRTFSELGYAMDPSLSDNAKQFIGNAKEAERRKSRSRSVTVFVLIKSLYAVLYMKIS